MSILIFHAARNVAGVGCGIRPDLTEEQKTAVREAIIKIWPKFCDRPIDESDLHNLGLR